MSIYLPHTDRDGVPIPNHLGWVRSLTRLLCTLNGGATYYRAFGAWINQHAQLIEEPVHVVVSFTEHKELTPEVREFINWFAEDTNQEAVMVEWDGTIHFYEPKRAPA